MLNAKYESYQKLIWYSPLHQAAVILATSCHIQWKRTHQDAFHFFSAPPPQIYLLLLKLGDIYSEATPKNQHTKTKDEDVPFVYQLLAVSRGQWPERGWSPSQRDLCLAVRASTAAWRSFRSSWSSKISFSASEQYKWVSVRRRSKAWRKEPGPRQTG